MRQLNSESKPGTVVFNFPPRNVRSCSRLPARRERARRAVVLLLLANGWSYRAIAEAVFASPTPLRAVKRTLRPAA